LKLGEDGAQLTNASASNTTAPPLKLQIESKLMQYLQAVREGSAPADQEAKSFSPEQLMIEATTYGVWMSLSGGPTKPWMTGAAL
jgi:hypothetical protein